MWITAAYWRLVALRLHVLILLLGAEVYEVVVLLLGFSGLRSEAGMLNRADGLN